MATGGEEIEMEDLGDVERSTSTSREDLELETSSTSQLHSLKWDSFFDFENPVEQIRTDGKIN